MLNINWIDAPRFRGEIVFVQQEGNGEEMRRVASLAEILMSIFADLAANVGLGAELAERAG